MGARYFFLHLCYNALYEHAALHRHFVVTAVWDCRYSGFENASLPAHLHTSNASVLQAEGAVPDASMTFPKGNHREDACTCVFFLTDSSIEFV